jgi:hypothetical protein
MTQYRLLLRPEMIRQLAALSRAAQTQPDGLRDREYRALKIGLLALADGREESFDGKRLGYSSEHQDLRDCAEIKLPVVHETRYDHELGPSHRLVYREFEPEDGGLPFREVICFEHRKDDRPFDVAGTRLAREAGSRLRTLQGVSDTRPHVGPRPPGEAAPVRQPMPPDLRAALAAASGIAPARGAINTPVASAPSTAARRGSPPELDRQR